MFSKYTTLYLSTYIQGGGGGALWTSCCSHNLFSQTKNSPPVSDKQGWRDVYHPRGNLPGKATVPGVFHAKQTDKIAQYMKEAIV